MGLASIEETYLTNIADAIRVLGNTDETYTPPEMAPAIYSGIDDMLDRAGVETKTTSGSIASFNDGADAIPVKSLKVSIEPVQAGEGDPSPENVRPITGWTGATVVRAGKNLWPQETIQMGDGQPRTKHIYFANPLPAGEYIMSFDTSRSTSNGNFSISFYFGPTGDYRTGQLNVSTGIVTLTGTTTRAYIYMPQNAFDSGLACILDNMQMEFGSTKTDYEAYKGETYAVTFPDEVGTVYGGTLDVASGVLTATHLLISRAVADMNNSEAYPGWRAVSELEKIVSVGTRGVIENTVMNMGTVCYYNAENLSKTLYLPSQYYDGKTMSDWKAQYPDLVVQILAPLLEPETWQLTPQEVRTLLGTNNIWADTGDVEVTYRVKPTSDSGD